MSSSDEEARGTAGNLSPATKPRKDRVRLELHLLGTEDSGSDDHLSSEGREGRLTMLQRAETRTIPHGQTTLIPTTWSVEL